MYPVSHGQKAVDPLKRPRTLSGSPLPSYVSHGQKAVDPLKLDRVARGSVHLAVSHGQKAVDPLKQAMNPTNLPPKPVVSHGQKAVDPLKRGLGQPAQQSQRRLPRSEGRGPIEAQ